MKIYEWTKCIILFLFVQNQVNLEYLTIDSQVIADSISWQMKLLGRGYMTWLIKNSSFKLTLQAFSTDNGRALEQIFGEHSEGSQIYDECLGTIATRLGTVFASLKVC